MTTPNDDPRCIHCGLTEKKHLGPRQWCPRGQHILIKMNRAMSTYSPKIRILEAIR